MRSKLEAKEKMKEDKRKEWDLEGEARKKEVEEHWQLGMKVNKLGL